MKVVIVDAISSLSKAKLSDRNRPVRS